MIPELTERRRPSDPTRDYCLWDFQMPVAPAAGALRTSALLYQSFAVAGITDKMRPVMQAIQDRWGKFNTVWGVKCADGQMSWEFYFYDYTRDGRAHGVSDFIDATQGLITCDVTPQDALPYFMFSVELTADNLNGAPLDQIDLYMGNPGSTVSSGICYGLRNEGLEMRNFYFFFNAATERQQITDKITESVHFPYKTVDLDTLLWPEMAGVETIVVANKRFRDSIYFSRIRASQMLGFIEKLGFPNGVSDHLRDNQHLFDHHLFDVGWDFDYVDGQIHPVKGSYYGLL
ncbi:MAG: hypothetical protein ACEPO0_00545 [Yoonia sp.]